MYESHTLIGNLGGDPEMRFTPSGVPVTNFSMACSKSWVGDDGQKHEETTWYRVTAWRKLAETASKYLRKGSKVLVVGEKLEARAYTDRDGNLRAALELTANTIRFLSTKGEAGADSGATAAPQQGGLSDEDDQIPF